MSFRRMTPGGRRRPYRSSRTLEAARADVLANLDDGTVCECCGQFAKRYRRKLNSSMARIAIYLARNSSPGEWVHVKNFSDISREVYQLGWWGFVEGKDYEGDEKRTAGLWRLTQAGRAFATGTLRAVRRAVVYNKQVERLEGDEIDVREALGAKFNYAELMGR